LKLGNDFSILKMKKIVKKLKRFKDSCNLKLRISNKGISMISEIR
jgi:hypothetical protein